jgi:hypothetical protein
MKQTFFLTLAVLFFAQLTPIAAQSEETFQPMKGTEQPISERKTETGNCYVFENYTVKTTTSEAVGEQIAIYKRAAATTDYCNTKARPYLAIENPDANYFIGLSGVFLFVDSGTSVESRGLEVFNLETKKSVYTTEYHDSVALENGKYVLYDKVSAKAGAIKTCRSAAKWKKEGFSIGWVQNTKIDLQTLKESPAGAMRCIALQ